MRISTKDTGRDTKSQIRIGKPFSRGCHSWPRGLMDRVSLPVLYSGAKTSALLFMLKARRASALHIGARKKQTYF